MKTKVTIFSIFFVFIVISSLLAVTYNYFTVSSKGESIILEWQTSDENNLEKFGIERRAAGSQIFVPIAYIDAKGYASNYTYEDKNIYKTTNDIYAYRLAFYEKNNPSPKSYSDIKVTSSNLSSVKRTWGMIKAMFR